MQKAAPSVALVCAGPFSRAGVARLPGLPAALGPVKSTSFRMASRVANALRGGTPVHTYESLSASQLILLSVPEKQLMSTVTGLANARLAWRGKAVILCGSRSGSEQLEELRGRGAATATFDWIDGLPECCFLTEGDPVAVRAIRAQAERGNVRAIEITRGGKGIYQAAESFATSMFLPVLAATAECLRALDLDNARANALTEHLIARSMRSHFKAGRKAWKVENDANLRQQSEALQRQLPELAEYYNESAAAARKWMMSRSAQPRTYSRATM